MNINNIKLLSKVELIQRLKQSGFGDVAVILEEKEVDGKKFVELTEFESFKWKLSTAQKRSLWNCIEGIKAKPSLLAVKPNPKLPRTVSFKEPRPFPPKAGDLNSFKGNLEGILCSNGRPSALKRPIVPPKAPSSSQNTSIIQISNDPDASPNEVPPPKRASAIRKIPLPLPQQDHDEYLSGYVEMQPPKQMRDQEEPEDYLTARELDENAYESPPVIMNRSTHSSRMHNAIDKSVPSASAVALQRRNASFENLSTKSSFGGRTEPVSTLGSPGRITSGRSNDTRSPILTKNLSLSSSNVQLTVIGSRKPLNLVDHNQKTQESTSFARSDKHEEEGCNIYEPPPPLKTKLVHANTNASGKRSSTPHHVYSNTTPHLNTRPSIRDLENLVIIDDKDANQETPVFSKITSTLSSIFKKNKPRALYENHTIITNTQEEETAIPVIRNRSLPSIPSEDHDITDQRAEHSCSIFQKPFPVPREIATPKHHSYITVISPDNTVESQAEESEETYENVKDHHKTNVKALGIRVLGCEITEKLAQTCEDMKSSEVTKNVPKMKSQKHLVFPKTSSETSQNLSTDEEADQIYENALKSNKKAVKVLRKIHQSPHRKSPTLNAQTAYEDEEETYENTAAHKLDVVANEEQEIYENAEPSKKTEVTSKLKEIGSDNNSSYVTLVQALNNGVQENMQENTEEEEDQIYQNTNKKHEKEKYIKSKEAPRSSSPLKNEASRNRTHNISIPPTQNHQYAADLASLLSKKLKERETRLQNKSGSLGDNTSTNLLKPKVADPLPIESHSNSDDTFSDSDAEPENHRTRKGHKLNQRPLPPLPDIPIEVPPCPKSMKKSPLTCSIGCTSTSSLEDIVTLGSGEQNTSRRPQPQNINTSSDTNREYEACRENLAERLGHQTSQRRSYERYRLPSDDGLIRTRPGSSRVVNIDDSGNSSNSILNYKDDPFFRDTRRQGAKSFLRSLSDGAFLFRPGTCHFLVLTVKYKNKFYNLGIERHGDKIRLSAEGDSVSPEFSSLGDFVDHFTRNPVTFQERNDVVEILLNPILPPAIP